MQNTHQVRPPLPGLRDTIAERNYWTVTEVGLERALSGSEAQRQEAI
ncbi:MAG: hypothetical protein NZM31_12625 [Gemmatales bacterium]|nr:hypothetical protein [Gemmatales bacterium]MDW8387840.1 hypothetical protein [Gemmatales bacterium]